MSKALRTDRSAREEKKHGLRREPARLAVVTLMGVAVLPWAPTASAAAPVQPKEHHKTPVRTQAAPARKTQAALRKSDPENIVVQVDRRRATHANGTLLTKSDWVTALTGSNPMALLASTPGISYTSSDSYGLDESDASLFMRGFHQNELGIMFEGIPLNDVSFGTLTGNDITNVGVPDNIGSIYVSPGTSRESTFSSSNNGGELRYTLQNPADKPGASINQSFGSNSTYVTTVTGNSGQIGENGPKILAGFQRISKDKYEGGGSQYMVRGDLKVTQDVSWGDFSLFFGASNAQIWGYNNLSFDMLDKLGWRGSDYVYPNYAAAYNEAGANASASCGAYTCGKLATLTPYDSGQTSEDYLGSIRHHFNITHALSGTILFYGATTRTDAALADPATPSFNGAPFSEQVQHSQVRRFGGTAELTYHIADHTISAGIWQEMADSQAGTAWYNEPLLGEGAPLRTIEPYRAYGPAFQVRNVSSWTTSSRQIYLHDDWRIRPDLTFGFGFKAVDFETTGGGVGTDKAPYGTLQSQNGFLPHLSLLWRPNAHDDLFLDAAQTQIGYRVFERGNIGYSASAWTATDQATFDEAARRLKPERDTTVTIGGHHSSGQLLLSYDAYFTLVEHRLIAASVGSLYNPVNTVGAVTASHIWGGDVALRLPVGRFLTLNQSLSVSRFIYGGNLNIGNTVFALRGKAQPGYPGISLNSSILLHYHHLQAGLTAVVYLEQPFNYENDIMARNYFNTTAFIAYDLPRQGSIPPLNFRFDVYNVLNEKMIGTIGVTGYTFSGDYQSMNRAAPRQALFTVGTKF